MRSQLDSSVYDKFAKKNNGLGDILGAVQGIQSIVSNSRALSRQKIEEGRIDKKLQQEELLNTTFGKHLSGWTGDESGHAANFETRTQMAMNEILQQDPTLYGEVADRIAKEMEKSQNAQKSALGLQREKVGLENDNLTVENNRLGLESAAIKHRMAQNELLTKAMSSVNTPEEYQQQYLFAVANLGNINLPDPRQNPNASQEFLQNKWQYLDKAKANEQQLNEQFNALKTREQKAKASTAEKENKWYDDKTRAEIDALGRSGTTQPAAPKPMSQNVALGMSASKQGIDMLDELVTKSDTFKSLSNSPLDKLRSKNPWDKDVQAFNQMIAVTKQVIGKGLEGGVLRKEDEAKYEKILPRLSDPIGIRKKKAEQLREMLVNKYNTDLETLGQAGVNISDFEYEGNRYYTPPDPSKKKAVSKSANVPNSISDDDLFNSLFGGN